MNNFCSVCGIEKSYDDYHRMYRRCDLCNPKHAQTYYCNDKDEILEKKKKDHNIKEFLI